MHEFGITLSVSCLALINVTRQWERSLILGSSNYRKNVDEDFFIPFWVHLVFNLRSGGRANPEWRHSVKTNPRLAISRPFSNAKIVRNNDMANFFEQKMSLFPLLKKRGSLWRQKRLSFVTGKICFKWRNEDFSNYHGAIVGLVTREGGLCTTRNNASNAISAENVFFCTEC